MSLRDEVKILVNSILLPHPKGLLIDKFMKEYVEIESKPIPFRALGYRDPYDLLSSMPDAVRCMKLPSGHILLQAVANKDVAHIQKMVSEQNNTGNTSARFLKNVLRVNNLYPRQNHQQHMNNNYRSSRQPSRVSHQAAPFRPVNNNYAVSHHQPTSNINTSMKRNEPQDYIDFLLPKLKEMFRSHPQGVLLKSVPGKFFEKYQHNIDLKQTGVTHPTELFARYSDTFDVWEEDKFTFIGLKGAANLKKCMPPLCEAPHPGPSVAKFSPVKPPPNLHQTPPPNLHLTPPNLNQMPPPKLHHEPPPIVHEENRTRYFSTPSPVERPHLQAHGNGRGHHEVHESSYSMNQMRGHQSTHDSTIGTNVSEAVSRRPAVEGSSSTKSPISALVESFSHHSIRSAPVTVRQPVVANSTKPGELPPMFGVSKPKVKNVYTPDIVLRYQEMPPAFNKFEYFFIIVAEVYSPGKFYWFLHENKAAIEKLTDDMNMFYGINSDYRIARDEVYVGQVVASQFTDDLWYRGRITACHRDAFEIFFLDYGSTAYVEMDKIRHLNIQFTKLPIQAMRGRVFGISPMTETSRWPIESGKQFLGLVKGSKPIAAVKMKEEFVCADVLPVSVLALVDTSGKEDVEISDFLVDNGFAMYDEVDQLKEAEASPDSHLETPQPTTPFPPTALNAYFSPMVPPAAVASSEASQEQAEPDYFSPDQFIKSINSVSNVIRTKANVLEVRSNSPAPQKM